MAIRPINNVNNITNLSFGENKEKPDTEKKSQISTQTKVIVGTGLAALAAVGIYIATRGMKSKNNEIINNSAVKTLQDILNDVKSKFPNSYIEQKTLKNGKKFLKVSSDTPISHKYVFDNNDNLIYTITLDKNKYRPTSFVFDSNDKLLREHFTIPGHSVIRKMFPDGKYYERDFLGKEGTWTLYSPYN